MASAREHKHKHAHEVHVDESITRTFASIMTRSANAEVRLPLGWRRGSADRGRGVGWPPKEPVAGSVHDAVCRTPILLAG